MPLRSAICDKSNRRGISKHNRRNHSYLPLLEHPGGGAMVLDLRVLPLLFLLFPLFFIRTPAATSVQATWPRRGPRASRRITAAAEADMARM